MLKVHIIKTYAHLCGRQLNIQAYTRTWSSYFAKPVDIVPKIQIWMFKNKSVFFLKQTKRIWQSFFECQKPRGDRNTVFPFDVFIPILCFVFTGLLLVNVNVYWQYYIYNNGVFAVSSTVSCSSTEHWETLVLGFWAHNLRYFNGFYKRGPH